MARRASAAKANKVPCQTGVCGTRNHIVGTYTQLRCAEAARLKASGQDITADNIMDIKPVGVTPSGGGSAANDAARDKMDSLKSAADAWKANPEASLGFIRWSAQFTDYSPFNRLMIYIQNPSVTQVAGRRKWAELGREVNEDAEDIAIFAPGSRPERPKKDENGKPILGPDGKPEMERVFVNRFKAVPVYDISDTSGDTPPEIETTVLNEDGLRALVQDLESSYVVNASESVMAGNLPARMDAEGNISYNTSTADENQQMVNRLVASGMAVSAHLRRNAYSRKSSGGDKWGHEEHLYAGVAAAWAIAQDANIDMTDLAVERMSAYAGEERASALATHAAKVAEHVNTVRSGMPISIADAMA